MTSPVRFWGDKMGQIRVMGCPQISYPKAGWARDWGELPFWIREGKIAGQKKKQGLSTLLPKYHAVSSSITGQCPITLNTRTEIKVIINQERDIGAVNNGIVVNVTKV